MSIPISEPLAVPTRPTLSAPSTVRSSPVGVRSTTAADRSPMRPSASHSLSTLSAWYALLGSVNRTTTTFSMSAILASLRSNNLVDQTLTGLAAKPRCHAAGGRCRHGLRGDVRRGSRRGRGAPSRAPSSAAGRSQAGPRSSRSAPGRPSSSPPPRARRRSTLTDASNARGTLVPAASSSPLTCTSPFPSPVTRVDLNRTTGCRATKKKSGDRRCSSRLATPVSMLAASIVSSISEPPGPTMYAPSKLRKRPRTVCRPHRCLTSNSTVVRVRSAFHRSTAVCCRLRRLSAVLISSPCS